MFGILKSVFSFLAVVGLSLGVILGGAKLLKYIDSLKGKQKPKAEAPVPPAARQEISGQKLFARKCELEQQMAGVVGGETGMLMLLDMIQNDPTAKGQDAHYRQSYREKQRRLNGYMEEYCTVLEQADKLPAEERVRFKSVKGMSQYQKLLDTEV